MMTKYYVTMFGAILVEVGLLGAVLVSSSAGEKRPPVAGAHLCLVDGKEARNDLYVESGVARLFACSEQCFAKMRSKSACMRLIEESGREPDRIPIKRSRDRTEEELLDGMALIEEGELNRPGSFLLRTQRRGEAPESIEHDGYKVRIESFYMDKYEVTYEDYCKFLNDGNEKYVTGGIRRDKSERFVPPSPKSAKLPMRGTTYFHAQGYAGWAGKRLPTEAEWEFAHGGSEGRRYPWGEEKPDATRANFGPTLKGLTPVGSLPDGQTPEGVFDLAGNIGEWCADFYDNGYYRTLAAGGPVKDPKGPKTGFVRVYRLGCQCGHSTTKDLRGNLRCYASPFRSAPCLGFRCVVSKNHQ